MLCFHMIEIAIVIFQILLNGTYQDVSDSNGPLLRLFVNGFYLFYFKGTFLNVVTDELLTHIYALRLLGYGSVLQ